MNKRERDNITNSSNPINDEFFYSEFAPKKNHLTTIDDYFRENLSACDNLTRKTSLILRKNAFNKIHKIEIKKETNFKPLQRKDKIFLRGWALPPKVGSGMILLESGFLIDLSLIKLNSSFFWEEEFLPESWFDFAFSLTTEWLEKYGPEALEAVFIERLLKQYCSHLIK